MTTYNDTSLNQTIFNKLTETQFQNASTLSAEEFYFVDPEFSGNKMLATDANGDIVETTAKAQKRVEDLISTSITMALAEGGTDYHYGTLTSLTITANEISDSEITIYFTAGSSISVNLPASLEFIGSAPYFEAGNKYAISIKNNILISGVVV